MPRIPNPAVSTSTPYPTQYPSQYPFSSSYPQNSTASPYTPQTAATNYPSYPVYSSAGYGAQPTTTQSGAQQNSGTGTITEEHIRASLLSAVEDKIKQRLKEKNAQYQAEIDVLKKTGIKLRNH
jgi:ESCRT-I complex subunit TSG101